MIWYLIGQIPVAILTGFSQLFGVVDTLPALGGFDIDAWISSGVAGFQLVGQLFPPFVLGLQIFIAWVGFLLSLRLARMIPFIGKAMPQD